MIELNPNGQFGSVAKILQRSAGLLDSVDELTSDTSMTYNQFQAGATIMAGGLRFKVAAEDAADHHLENAAVPPLKVYAQPNNDADLSPIQFGACRDGVTDDGDAVAACMAYAQANGYVVDLGVGEYRIGARSTPLMSYNRRTGDAGANRFRVFGRGPSKTRFNVQGDCTDFLFKVEGNTDGYSVPDPRASWFEFRDFAINGNGHNVDLFSFICADRCILDNVSSFDTHGYGVYARQWWDSLCNVRFVKCGDNLRIPFDAGTDDFTRGQTVTGAISGATAWVMDVEGGPSGILHVTNVTGTFLDDEIISGDTVGSATTQIPNGIEGAQKAVIDFDFQFKERLADSACNQIKFPETVQIESYRWRALHWGRASRQNYFGGKIHWEIGRDYGGPAVYLDGPSSNHFVPGMMITHTENQRGVLVDGTNYNATGNRFIGVSGGQGITFTGDCRENIIGLCAFNNTNGTGAIILEGGRDNMIRDNMPRGNGPELENTASSPDYALLDRVIPERVRIGQETPPEGWGAERLSVYDATQDLLMRVASGDATASIEIADANTTDDLRISAQGNTIIAPTLTST